jgi:hypothetical protein
MIKASLTEKIIAAYTSDKGRVVRLAVKLEAIPGTSYSPI